MCFRATPLFAVCTRLHHLCRCQAALHGASGATRSQMACPQRYRATMHHLIAWRVNELSGAHGVEVGEDAAEIVPAGSDRLKCRDAECADTAFCLRQAALQAASVATRRNMICPQRCCATIQGLITWRVTELYGAQWRRRQRRRREDCACWV